MMRLCEFVDVRRRFMRSVNIVRDQGNMHSLDGYVLSPLILQTLQQIGESLLGNSRERAFTLTGPYGSGKSAFGLFLQHLLQDSTLDSRAWRLLLDSSAEIANDLHAQFHGKRHGDAPYLVLPVVCRRASVCSLLAEAFESLDNLILDNEGHRKLNQLQESSDSKTTLRLLEELVASLVPRKYRGVVLVFDEMGKLFEEAYYNERNTDIFTLQELAELAARSSERPIVLLGILHQSISNYVDDIVNIKTKNEFAKIEGRFQPLAFIESPAAQIRLLASALENKGVRPAKAQGSLKKRISNALKINLADIAGLPATEFQEQAMRAWPIHPLALVALPLLFRRFGQNERSLFNFLSSNEACSFQEFLQQGGSASTLGLEQLFDYLLANYEVQLSNLPHGKVFLEGYDILHSKSLSQKEQSIIKIIAVLNSLGTQSILRASKELIGYALDEDVPDELLQRLQTQSILVYRKFSNAYSIWEGSDIDLVERYKKADEAISRSGLSLAHPLQGAFAPRPMIARRHSYRTGALRYFSVEYIDSPDDLEEQLRKANKLKEACGRIIVCLTRSPGTRDTFKESAVLHSFQDNSLLFAIPGSIEDLHDAVYELQRLRWVIENTKQLRDDRIAQREIDLRQAEAQRRLNQLHRSLLDPRTAKQNGSSCEWFWQGKQKGLQSNKDVSALLSRVCDLLYEQSPCILNEMINKRKISTQASAARNSLIKRLINPSLLQQENLGIEGFPPERSIYASLLAGSGLHRKVSGVWQLCAADPKSPVGLSAAWEFMEEAVFSSTAEPLPLQELYASLSAPPYGLLEGVLPILLVHFYVLHRSEVTLYYENSFLPDPHEAHFELLVRRPDLFAVAGARIKGMRKRVINRLSRGLGCEASVSAVARHLYRMLGGLSKYAMTTNRASGRSLAFRQALEQARSPEKLLFIDLPKVFSLDEVSEEAGNHADFDLYFSALNSCLGELSSLLPGLISEQRAILLSACKLEDSEAGWGELYRQACELAPKINDIELIPFIRAIRDTGGDWNQADAVMGTMLLTPMHSWGTLDLAAFPGVAEGKAQRFLDAYQPYQDYGLKLSATKKKEAKALQAELMRKIRTESEDRAVRRAALLACLKELDKETGNNE